MLVTFHSDAYEDITYFGDVAKQLLSLMGHSGTVPGAIKFEDLPQALEHLQHGLAGSGSQSSDKEDEDGEVLIGLAKRAIPLINLLQASIRDECNVLWDA
ncbi:MAG: DUF1840 domain-containing protein [Legionella sp.]|uniref:DUF1840 domain-containing protein n=1 Tax=Legionella sp. TaxID=459 RepID=UPI00284C3BED|nr:DUF1840 domain-containing protein [Legionella sp.]